MRRRGIGFTAVILLVTLLTLTPYVAGLAYLGWLSYLVGGDFPLEFIGLTPTAQYWSELNSADLIQDRLYFAEFDDSDSENTVKMFVRSADPETGQGMNATKSVATTFDAGDASNPGWSSEYQFAGEGRQWWMMNPGKLDELFEFDGMQLTKLKIKIPNSSSIFDEDGKSDLGINATRDAKLPYINGRDVTLPYVSSSPAGISISSGNALNPKWAFIQNGRFTIVVEFSEGRRELLQLVDNAWESLGVINLLNTTRGWQNADNQKLFDPQPELALPLPYGVSMAAVGTTVTGVTNSGQIVSLPGSQATVIKKNSHPNPGTLRIVQHGPTCHLFWQVADRLLYRNGVELKPKNPKQIDSTSKQSAFDETISALEPTNVLGISRDWSLVTELKDQIWSPALVGGKPTVLLIENVNSQAPGSAAKASAKALRLDGTQWKEHASIALPYGSESYNVVWRDDGSTSYFCTTTGLGRTRIFAIEPTGFRQTGFDHAPIPCGLYEYALVPTVWGWSFIAGMILALVTTFLLRREPAKFAFGHQSVQLASTFERGFARTIDLGLLLLLTSILLFGLVLARPPDWRTALEAVNLEDMSHPSILDVLRIVAICLGSLAFGNLVLIFFQGRHAITPGKWLCGLRSVRTTLKPCGFARSLLRELLLCIDSLNLLSWSPGILFITFTENRQRFGDLMADTIVIRTKSLHSAATFSRNATDEQHLEP